MQVIYAGLNIPQFPTNSAFTDTDKGVLALTVRKDTAASLVNTDGDYSGLLVDDLGRLHTNVGIINSFISTNNSTSSTR